MEKLIELLNEYEKYISMWWLADWREFDWNLHYYCNYKDEYVFDNVHYRIISKNYWFIKRLIDKWKVSLLHRPRNEDIMDLDRSDYEKLLMMLAVDPDPVKYLISMIE